MHTEFNMQGLTQITVVSVDSFFHGLTEFDMHGLPRLTMTISVAMRVSVLIHVILISKRSKHSPYNQF